MIGVLISMLNPLVVCWAVTDCISFSDWSTHQQGNPRKRWHYLVHYLQFFVFPCISIILTPAHIKHFIPTDCSHQQTASLPISLLMRVSNVHVKKSLLKHHVVIDKKVDLIEQNQCNFWIQHIKIVRNQQKKT